MANSFAEDYIPWPHEVEGYRKALLDPAKLPELVERKPSREYAKIFDSRTPTPEVQLSTSDQLILLRDWAMFYGRELQRKEGKAGQRLAITSTGYWRIEATFLEERYSRLCPRPTLLKPWIGDGMGASRKSGKVCKFGSKGRSRVRAPSRQRSKPATTRKPPSQHPKNLF